eukprot:4898831-Ditylum_brightwellii.AAC.1
MYSIKYILFPETNQDEEDGHYLIHEAKMENNGMGANQSWFCQDKTKRFSSLLVRMSVYSSNFEDEEGMASNKWTFPV